MVSRRTIRRTLLGREVALAYAGIGGLYVIRHVRFQPVQIPAYLLIVAYDFVEIVIPAIAPYHPIGFPVFLYLLAVVAGAGARWSRQGPDGRSRWVRAAGGVCSVVAVLAFLFAAAVGGPLVSPADNPTPLVVTGATGLVFAAAAWWLLVGRPSVGRVGAPENGR